MCILCVIQKWARRVATMLPWLVIPLIGLWALSQLLPQDYRFEITSPRLACVFVLLVTLFWYEILMPQLSAWRVRRNARLRERKRFEAIELQKLRKTATRRCRNCLTPYRDQNPGGGKFMCSYCGHMSTRPVLDLPAPPGLGMSNSGIIKDLVGKSGKILNGKPWGDNGWMCNQDWLENGNWVGGSISGKSNHWRKNGSGVFGGDDNCFAEKSYSNVVVFACKLLTSLFLSIRWIWRKIFRVSSSDDASSDADNRGMLTKRGENEDNYHLSRGEKARRKAEEKRQAKLEKELLEDEERKQREEVARLVEERRRLRDEIMEAEKERSRSSTHTREKNGKKEAEKKRQDRRKDRDKGSSKSNSDVEEMDKKAGKESERRRDADKKSETDIREHVKTGTDNVKRPNMESTHGMKNTGNFTRTNAGTRYLDRMRGTILSSSRAFSGSGFFGKTVIPSVTKESKSNSSVDHINVSHRRDMFPPDCPLQKSCGLNGDDKNVTHPVLSEPPPVTAPKKSWHHLFSRSSPATSSSSTNVISRPNPKPQEEVLSSQLPGQLPSIKSYDNPINFGLPSPFLTTLPNVSTASTLGFSTPIEPIVPRVVEGPCEFIPEEAELFEDPCDDPYQISLLGPVSKDLQLDKETGFPSGRGYEKPQTIKNLSSASPDFNKPSPIESPLSRVRISEAKQNVPNWFSTSPKAQDLYSIPVNDMHVNEKGTWQMWNSSPLGQDGLGLVGASGSWLLPPELNKTKGEMLQPVSQKTMASLFTKDDQILSGTQSPQKVFLGNSQNSGPFSPVTGSRNPEPWLQNSFFSPLPGSDSHFSLKSQEETTPNELIYGSPSSPAVNNSFEMSPGNGWSKMEWGATGGGEGVGKSSTSRANVGGFFSSSDVQSLWRFD